MSLSELGPCKVVIDAISPDVCLLEDPKRGAVINAIRNKLNRIQNHVNTIAQLVDKLEVCCVCGKQGHGTAQELSKRSKNMAYPSLSSSFISYAVTVQGKPAATITPRIMPPTKEQQLNSPSSYAVSADWSENGWNRNELATEGLVVGQNVLVVVVRPLLQRIDGPTEQQFPAGRTDELEHFKQPGRPFPRLHFRIQVFQRLESNLKSGLIHPTSLGKTQANALLFQIGAAHHSPLFVAYEF